MHSVHSSHFLLRLAHLPPAMWCSLLLLLFKLVITLHPGLPQFGESNKQRVYICHEESVLRRSLQHLNLRVLHNPTFALAEGLGCVFELTGAGNWASVQGDVNILLWAELCLPHHTTVHIAILTPST